MEESMDMIVRGWNNFLARPDGAMHIRFFIQPALASLIAIHAGWKDASVGRPPFLWGAFMNIGYQRKFFHQGWKDLRIALAIGTTIDIIYQLLTVQWIYPLELIFTVTLLVIVPYMLLRDPVNRIARMFIKPLSKASIDKENHN
jgi:hypothetical protein